MSFLLAIFLILSPPLCSAATIPAPLYAVAAMPTPVLNTPEFQAVFGGSDGRSLHLDKSGLLREVEFVALPGTVFHIEASLERGGRTILRVTTDDYPYPSGNGYYVDSRFVRDCDTLPPPRIKELPKKNRIIAELLAARESRYVWGGNFRAGIPQMLQLYPPAEGPPLAADVLEMWKLKGVDCSGLLYEATSGFTPRNTSSLVGYGRGVMIEGRDAEGIISLLEPLDLIVWTGHVMIVLDRDRLIESRLEVEGSKGGVVVRPLRQAVEELLRRRKPLDDFSSAAGGAKEGFVVRRWYPGGDE